MKQQLYDLPEGWEWKSITELCEYITDGSHSSPKTFEDGLPYVTVKDIKENGVIDLDNCKKISLEDFSLLVKNNCAPPQGSILLSKDGTVGKVAIVDTTEPFVVLSSLAIIKPLEKYISSYYFKYFLLTPYLQEHVIGVKTGAAIKRIVLRTIKSLYIPLPNNDQQNRIVKKLDTLLPKIDTAIDYLQRNIALADELFTCILSKAFNPLSLVTNGQDSSNYNLPIGWQRKTIGELCYKVTDGSHNPPKPSEEGKPMLSSRNILDGYIAWNNYRLIPNNLFEKENARTQIQNGDVLLTIVGTIGRSCVVENIKEEFTVQRSVAVIASNILEPNFLSLQLRSPELQTHFNRNAKGAAQKGIYLKKLKEIFILYPTDYEEQKSIVKKISLLDSYIKALNNDFNLKINQLTELKNSILDAAFKGKL